MLCGLVIFRLAFPATGAADEQDVSLFGECITFRLTRFISAREDDQLVPALQRAYTTMRQEQATPLSPFLSTALLQQPDLFDTVLVEPVATSKTGVIFLQGFGGNFSLECWLFAHAVQNRGIMTVCPSVSWRGDWWTDAGRATLQYTIDYLRQRGIERIYLVGLSNGAVVWHRSFIRNSLGWC